MLRSVVLGAVVVLAFAGCGPAPEPTPSPTGAPTATSSPTPSPTPAGPTPVDPAAYATQVADLFGEGVDFDSPDGNVHCGIWAAKPLYVDDVSTPGTYAGCRPTDATYQTEPSTTPDGEIGCRGGQIPEGQAAGPVCGSGQEFVGEAPIAGAVGVLPVGSSIAFAGITCVAPDPETIECVRDADGHGFSVGRTSYRYF